MQSIHPVYTQQLSFYGRTSIPNQQRQHPVFKTQRLVAHSHLTTNKILTYENTKANMANYNEDQISEYQDAFALFDKKGDGKISCSQVGEVLRALGLSPLLSEIKKLEKEIDESGEKRLSFDEFLPIYHEQSDKQPLGCTESFIEAFRIFDLDNNGLVSAGEIRHLLTMLGDRLTNDEVDILLQGVEDTSGKVHYEEFVKNVMN